MDACTSDCSSLTPQRWRKVAYGGMQPGYDDNHTDETFLADMVMNASVVKRDILKLFENRRIMLFLVEITQRWINLIYATMERLISHNKEGILTETGRRNLRF
ncbi:hypothetical protein LWI29_010366 [Acer saccharum]|uniref:Uncharacterized protein n=1 Tax=Acer saccharum TaxID=4024 RepID=A0AA39V786_ACESA|nr:hypothetical protein LWI29_010366 [Acer saccharum]